MDTNSIQSRAMLVNLSISVWTARKYDAGATADACRASNAASNAGRFNKALLPKAALAGIQTKAGEIRARHYELTLPWDNNGARILPVEMYEKYQAAIYPLIEEFDRLVNAFVPAYSEFRRMAKQDLGAMYNESDYPATVRDKFAVEVEVSSIPSSDHFYARVSDGQVNAIREQITKTVENRLQGTVNECWDRLKGQLSKMVDRLGTEDAIFRDSLTENLLTLLDTLPALNVTGDPALDKSIMDTRRMFQRAGRFIAPDQLRNDKGLRKTVAAETARILKEMESLTA